MQLFSPFMKPKQSYNGEIFNADSHKLMVLPSKGGENGPHALYYGSKSSFKDCKQWNAKQQQKEKRKKKSHESLIKVALYYCLSELIIHKGMPVTCKSQDD